MSFGNKSLVCIVFFILLCISSCKQQEIAQKGETSIENNLQNTQSSTTVGDLPQYTEESFQTDTNKYKILFFTSKDCPECLQEIDLQDLKNTTIFTIPFYDNLEIVQKYRVLRSPMFVLTDTDGNMIKLYDGILNTQKTSQDIAYYETLSPSLFLNGFQKYSKDSIIWGGNIAYKVLFFPGDGEDSQTIESSLQSAIYPLDVAVYKVELDTFKEISTLYNVSKPNTFVRVNDLGNEVTSWEGSKNIDDILYHLGHKESSFTGGVIFSRGDEEKFQK